MSIGITYNAFSVVIANWNPRLLSAAGIPKLRKKAKSHLKFKGKGHEVYTSGRPPSNKQPNQYPVLRCLETPGILSIMA